MFTFSLCSHPENHHAPSVLDVLKIGMAGLLDVTNVTHPHHPMLRADRCGSRPSSVFMHYTRPDRHKAGIARPGRLGVLEL